VGVGFVVHRGLRLLLVGILRVRLLSRSGSRRSVEILLVRVEAAVPAAVPLLAADAVELAVLEAVDAAADADEAVLDAVPALWMAEVTSADAGVEAPG